MAAPTAGSRGLADGPTVALGEADAEAGGALGEADTEAAARSAEPARTRAVGSPTAPARGR